MNTLTRPSTRWKAAPVAVTLALTVVLVPLLYVLSFGLAIRYYNQITYRSDLVPRHPRSYSYFVETASGFPGHGPRAPAYVVYFYTPLLYADAYMDTYGYNKGAIGVIYVSLHAYLRFCGTTSTYIVHA
jgi:hypothetical protein